MQQSFLPFLGYLSFSLDVNSACYQIYVDLPTESVIMILI